MEARVSDLGDYYLMVLTDQSGFRGEVTSNPTYVRMLRDLHEALAQDPRFRKISWLTQGEMDGFGPDDAEGAPTPLNAKPQQLPPAPPPPRNRREAVLRWLADQFRM